MLFYELKINYQRQTGEDSPAGVKETYLVEGLTCSDVETRLLNEIRPFIFGDSEVTNCKKSQFFDIIPSSEADHWYKARVEMITVEDNGKESRKAVSILVQATTIDHALKNLNQHLQSVDCEIINVAKSPILEVYRAV